MKNLIKLFVCELSTEGGVTQPETIMQEKAKILCETMGDSDKDEEFQV